MRLFEDVRRKVLANGMEILVREDRNTPVVALNFFVRVGSLNEDESVAGWSHGIEHMLFKGTERRGPGDIAREINELGGETNAGTGYESTNYYILAPKENFRRALDIHADVLRHSTFDPEELEKEREVLIKENEMYRDRPRGYGYTWEDLLDEAFTRHRYKRPIGGPDENLRRASREVIVAHKEKYYVPNNITYVVVGDVASDEAFAAMEEAFGDWPSGSLDPDRSSAEPPQRSFRYRETVRDVEKCYVKIGFHVPPELHPDTEALLVLAHVLAGGKTSRLYERVRERDGLILDCAVLEATGIDPGYLAVEFSTPPEKVEDALTAVYREILGFQSEPVTEAELDRMLRAVVSDTVFTLETMEGQASALGHFAMLGDYSLAGTTVERLSRVDAHRIQEVARRYLQLEQSTALVLWPETVERAPWSTPQVYNRLRHAAASGPDNGDQKANGVTPRVSMPALRGGERSPVERIVLDRGTTVLLQGDARLPLVAVAAYVPTGSGGESDAEAGLAHLTQECMLKGSNGLSASQFADALESLGARLRPLVSRDVSGFSLSLLRDDLSRGLELFGGMLARPAFAEQPVARERERTLAQLAALSDDTVQFTLARFYAMMFPGHAYARPVLGAEDALAAFGPEDLRRWHRRIHDPARMVVSVVGDFDREKTLRELEAALALLAPDGPFPGIDPVAPRRDGAREEIIKDVAQAVVVLGCPGPGVDTPDRYALEVWNAVLSGMGNRLFTRLRDEKHLCYFTGAFVAPLARGGAIGAYVGTGVDQVDEATEALVAELSLSAREAPTEEEVGRARTTLLGQHLIDMQTRMAWAGTYARDEVIGLGHEETERFLREIRTVTPEQAREAAARHLDPARLVTAVLRPSGASIEDGVR